MIFVLHLLRLHFAPPATYRPQDDLLIVGVFKEEPHISGVLYFWED
jgi:hypothetical protein